MVDNFISPSEFWDAWATCLEPICKVAFEDPTKVDNPHNQADN